MKDEIWDDKDGRGVFPGGKERMDGTADAVVETLG